MNWSTVWTERELINCLVLYPVAKGLVWHHQGPAATFILNVFREIKKNSNSINSSSLFWSFFAVVLVLSYFSCFAVDCLGSGCFSFVPFRTVPVNLHCVFSTCGKTPLTCSEMAYTALSGVDWGTCSAWTMLVLSEIVFFWNISLRLVAAQINLFKCVI